MKSLFAAALLLALALPAVADEKATAAPGWSMNATAIEACSCPMFCQCYFSTGPAGHAMEGIARQPEAGGRIGTNMIIAAALIEGFTFFALVICKSALTFGA